MPGISVALPVGGESPGPAGADLLRRALACVREQTLPPDEILLVLNGVDAPRRDAARHEAKADPRTRLIELPEANLAAALNAALEAARTDLVARMDADDSCHPERLSRQAAFLGANPRVAALGTAFESIDEDTGERIGIDTPPTDPAEVRWRLLLGNCLCHGSVMLRRSAALAAGGYDSRLPRAQDYDLWLRLARSHDVASLPEVLYTHRTSLRRRKEVQARHAADLLLGAWADLPAADAATRDEAARALHEATWGGARARAALRAVEALLRARGPSRELLLARQWIAPRAAAAGPELWERHRLAAAAAAASRLRDAGAGAVWLYGAGRHTEWLIDNADVLAVPIAGIIDDAPRQHGRRIGGHAVRPPDAAPPGAHVLLSSDAHEDALWHASAPLRARGTHVHPLYAGFSAGPTPPPASRSHAAASSA